MKKILGIEGMTCGHCQKRVTEALAGLPGVKKAVVSLAEKKAEVESAVEIPDDLLKNAVADAGYQVTSIAAG